MIFVPIFSRKYILLIAFIVISFSFSAHHAFAANRFWVGGGSTADWHAVAPTNWSTTSGGANNASVPTASDDVFFDSNSGLATVTLDGIPAMKSLDFTGFSGTIDQAGANLILNINSNAVLKFSPTMTYIVGSYNSSSQIQINDNGCPVLCTLSLTTAGKIMPTILFAGSSNINLDLQDDFNSSMSVQIHDGGTFNTNDHNISTLAAYLYCPSASDTATLNMGSSTWTITGNDVTADEIGVNHAIFFEADGTNCILNPGTSTFKFTDSTSNPKTIYSNLNVGNIDFYDIWFSGTGTGSFNMVGYASYTLNNLKIDNPPHEFTFDYISDLLINSLNISGSAGNLNTINSNDGVNPFGICKASGVVNADYLNLSNSEAICGATWYAGANSIDGGGNTGWIFAPTLSIQPATVGTTTATLNGTITATGGENASTRGFQYGPDTSYGTTTTESGSFSTGAYTSDITGLTCNTTYHVRSYATNGSGTHYSSDTTFTTSACPIVQQGRPATPVIIPIPTPVLPATTTPTTPVVEKPVQETVIETVNKTVEKVTTVKEKPVQKKVVVQETPKEQVIVEIPTKIVTETPIPEPVSTNITSSEATTPSLLSILSLSINQSIFDTKVAIDKTNEKIKTVLESKEGTVVSRAVTTTGIVAGATISITGALFLNPISFSEIFFIPMRLWALLMSALGLKKRNKPWGVVYDSVTKQPIDPAYVVLQDLEGNVITNSITDLDGRYGFLVSKGTYKIIANKTNYYFPSKKLSGHFSDSLYSDLYWGDYFKIENDGEVISKNIPIDPVNFDWNEFAKRDKGLMKFYSLKDVLISRISDVLFWTGFSVISLATLTAPRTYNIATFLVYVVIFILKHTVLKSQSHGVLREKSTGLPLSFAIIRVCSAKTDVEIAHKVADKLGKYYCLVPNGTYYVKIEKKNLDESYTLIYKSDPMEVREGIVRNNFEV